LLILKEKEKQGIASRLTEGFAAATQGSAQQFGLSINPARNDKIPSNSGQIPKFYSAS
jgi:hypothetical protein